eukprot:6210082-Amphidinium_carterae.1
MSWDSVKKFNSTKSTRSTGTIQQTTSINSICDQQRHVDAKTEVSLWRQVTDANCEQCIHLQAVFWDPYLCYLIMASMLLKF